MGLKNINKIHGKKNVHSLAQQGLLNFLNNFQRKSLKMNDEELKIEFL